MTKERKVRKDHKYKFTKEDLRQQIFDALMWASDGVEITLDGTSIPYVMGDPENLTIILTEALTVGLPNEDSSSATTA